MAEQSFKIYKDTAERLEKNALDIADLKEDLDNTVAISRVNLNDESLATDGYFYNPSGVPQRNSLYSYSDFIPVKKGDTVRCLADTTINNKAITFFDKNKKFLFQTTNSSGEHPSTRIEWKRLDSGTRIIYIITYTINEEVACMRYSYATSDKGIADMLTVNMEMPIDYIPYSYQNISIAEKVKIPSAKQIEDFEEKVKEVSNLNGLKIGFLGDSFTDVSNYYGKMIADRTGLVAYNYGKQGSRIYADSIVSGNIVQSFWKRVLNMEKGLDCIVVFGGINDGSSRTIYETNLGTIDDTVLTQEQIEAGETPTSFYSACKTIYELLMNQYQDKKILMVIPPHVLNSSYDVSLKAYMGIEKIIEAEKNVADFYGIPVCDLWKNCTEMNNFQGNVAIYRLGSSNDIHPNTKGQYAISVLIQKSLENLFD
nr:MAG TPA: GDSL like Lipase Acylhydrolase [Caudoviricetes sp.]